MQVFPTSDMILVQILRESFGYLDSGKMENEVLQYCDCLHASQHLFLFLQGIVLGHKG